MVADQRTTSKASRRPGPKAEDGKVRVIAGRAPDPQTLHDGEAGAVDDGKVLITPGHRNLPGTSTSAPVTDSIIATLASRSQKASAGFFPIRWRKRVHVSISM